MSGLAIDSTHTMSAPSVAAMMAAVSSAGARRTCRRPLACSRSKMFRTPKYVTDDSTTVPPIGTRYAIAVAAARPEANVTARPPSSAPSAASSAPQPALPSRPYSTVASWTYVELIVMGAFIAAPATRAGRPACTATVSAAQAGSRSRAAG